MVNEQIATAWQAAWAKHLEDVQNFQSKLGVKKEHLDKACVQDHCRNYIAANINTHRVVYLPQALNGKVTADELRDYLESQEEITVTGELKTNDGASGISEAKLICGGHRYEIVFSELPFYTAYDPSLERNGGILNADAVLSRDTVFERNVLCSGTLIIEKGASLTVKEGATIVPKNIENHGTFRGTITGNIHLYDGADFNGSLFTGCMSAEGHVTITGLYVADTLTVSDDSVVLLDNSCGMFNAMDIGKNVTLIFADAEPGLCGFENAEWYMDYDHPLEDVMRQKWFLLGDITPTDMLGRMWSVPFDKKAILRPDLNGGGVIKMEPDLAIRGKEGTHHNYAVLAFGKESITDVAGVVYAYTTFGLAHPKADADNLIVSQVTGEGTEASPYIMTFTENDPKHPYASPMDLSLQALASPVVSAKFEGLSWRFAELDDGFVWYGYRTFKDCEHWHGENGKEILKVFMRRAG